MGRGNEVAVNNAITRFKTLSRRRNMWLHMYGPHLNGQPISLATTRANPKETTTYRLPLSSDWLFPILDYSSSGRAKEVGALKSELLFPLLILTSPPRS